MANSTGTQVAPQINFSEDTLKSLSSKITSSKNIHAILPGLIDELRNYLNCDALNLFALDKSSKQLYTLNNVSDKVSEIRVEMSNKTLVGYVSGAKKAVNVPNINSMAELSMYHSDMEVGSTLEKKLNIKTRSMMVIPLPFEKKLIGVAEFINKSNNQPFTSEDFKIAKELAITMGHLTSQLTQSEEGDMQTKSGKAVPQEKLIKIANAIHSAKNVDEILIEMKHAILELFNAALITIYAIEPTKKEIYSKMKSGDSVNEIRVPISTRSIAGCVAMQQKMVNIANVYNQNELKKYHKDLAFDSSWDKKSGFKTKNMLVSPLIHQNKLMGVLQLVNKKDPKGFSPVDEKYAKLISETLGLAFSNQGKFVKPKPTKFSYLIDNGIITDTELSAAVSKARRSPVDIEDILMGEYAVARKDLGNSLELFYDVPYVEHDDSAVLSPEIVKGLNASFMAKNLWVPIERNERRVTILIDNPINHTKIQNIKTIFKKEKVEFKVGLKVDITGFLNSAVNPQKTEGFESILQGMDDEKREEGGVAVSTADDESEENAISETDGAIVKLVFQVLVDAYDQGVSDIHIEPGIGKDHVMVRFRKDGACRVYQEIPTTYKQAVISRIKIMSKLDIAERRLPQDGKIKMKYGEKEIEFRVATCPTVGGNEDAVLRILAASKPIPLDKMNFSPRNLELTQNMATKPYGLVLVVGPTGSGKTTTLHSTLGYINTPEKKIWTAEDPVEITQKGLRQVQMLSKIGLDFSRAMRSFLRGDPDVIMVGEMRDSETCSIGLEASLTGHLVFSTLHTNSAPETITRLLDMGMNPLNFADALLLIVAQRLVRTLCKKCKEDYHPSKEEFDTLVHEYGAGFEKLGIKYTDDLMLKRPVGCKKCTDTGYAGRTGLHECLEATEDVKRMVMKQALVEDLRKQAIKDGMTTLKQDGIWKVFKGDCDLKQVMSVCIV